MAPRELWERYKRWLVDLPDLGFRLDVSRMDLPDDYAESLGDRLQAALASMAQLEQGAIANPDEQRMVGHYWLRAAHLAPDNQIRSQ